MAKWIVLLLGSWMTVMAFGCAPQEPQVATGASSGVVCPHVSPGPPPVCPEGCKWNSKECRKHQGIIMDAPSE